MSSKLQKEISTRLADLRKELIKQNLEGFLIPRADEYQNEYVPKNAERLAWISGFTGSAGLAIVTQDKAAIFVDGRYTLQAQAEIPENLFSHHNLTEKELMSGLMKLLPSGGRLGYDPWLHTHAWEQHFAPKLAQKEINLIACQQNLLDLAWGKNRPASSITPVVPHELVYAGRSSEDKRREIAETLSKESIDVAVITQPDSLAWLLNIRGQDVPYTPFALGFAILYREGAVDLFMDQRKLSGDTRSHLGKTVHIYEPEAFIPSLQKLGKNKKKVRIDPQAPSVQIVKCLQEAGAQIDFGSDPCILPKARKNKAEIEGARLAHRRDGVALVRFFHWLEETLKRTTVTEIEAADQLLVFRREGDLFKDLSFETIAGVGSNGAIVHYHSTPGTNRPLQQGTLFLLDIGAQYLDGTTDVTRTIAIGEPTPEMKDRFTRVLIGHITLAKTCFPEGTTGNQLDSLARWPLWQLGLDYNHGTGHGVGSYLSVHEGPQGISPGASKVSLQPGMIVSNEPGYYKAGEYGIRIESLVLVQKTNQNFSLEKDWFHFETLTLVPIDRRLIDNALLTSDHKEWLNSYHQRVRQELTPFLSKEVADWLSKATEAI